MATKVTSTHIHHLGGQGRRLYVVWAGHLSPRLNSNIPKGNPSTQNTHQNEIDGELPSLKLQCCLTLNSLVRGAVLDDVSVI